MHHHYGLWNRVMPLTFSISITLSVPTPHPSHRCIAGNFHVRTWKPHVSFNCNFSCAPDFEAVHVAEAGIYGAPGTISHLIDSQSRLKAEQTNLTFANCYKQFSEADGFRFSRLQFRIECLLWMMVALIASCWRGVGKKSTRRKDYAFVTAAVAGQNSCSLIALQLSLIMLPVFMHIS